MQRREFLRAGVASATAVSLGPAFWSAASGASGPTGGGPYGSLDGRAADGNGLVLPEGFTSRVVATTGEPVADTGYAWHAAPDGGATFEVDDGWIYVSNSEFPGTGGASAVRFDDVGEIVDAYRVLDGTSVNCAGGPTPWGTWLSCEEFDVHGVSGGLADLAPTIAGQVWECDPTGTDAARALPALGLFQHEAVAVDPDGQALYLTEDQGDGLLYRFTPTSYPDLSAGELEAAVLDGSSVSWVGVPDPSAAELPTRQQAGGATTFAGGEGIWFADGVVYFTTKGDGRVQAIDLADDRFEVLFDPEQSPDAPLTGVDNITVAHGSGDLFIAEDGGNMEVVLLTPEREVVPFARVEGHEGSEVTGPAFSPDRTRLYLSSQRGVGGGGVGVTYEITGPFRSADEASPTTTIAGASETAPDQSAGASSDDGGSDALPYVLGAAGVGAVAAAGAVVALRSRRSR